ncbi:winged helix-turn helix domain protein [Leptospira santarosai str. HAI1349]|nr:winged helix-turn-helix domain-containing protein [Leptospira santarosai]EMJ48261.1 winged helix-turn helix domain protein [Leptospira santarosai str. HAI1349]
MGFSYQKPKRRALERNESSIKTWKTETWMDIKKKPRMRDSRSYF